MPGAAGPAACPSVPAGRQPGGGGFQEVADLLWRSAMHQSMPRRTQRPADQLTQNPSSEAIRPTPVSLSLSDRSHASSWRRSQQAGPVKQADVQESAETQPRGGERVGAFGLKGRPFVRRPNPFSRRWGEKRLPARHRRRGVIKRDPEIAQLAGFVRELALLDSAWRSAGSMATGPQADREWLRHSPSASGRRFSGGRSSSGRRWVCRRLPAASPRVGAAVG